MAIVSAMWAMSCYAQVPFSERELARGLSTPALRADTVASIAGSGRAAAALLLRWADSPPMGINEYELDIGLADVFGELRIKSAIPFLIRKITIDRTPLGNTWLKSAAVLEDRLAAVSALIRIGPEAALAVMRAYGGPMTDNERLAAIFVVSRLQDVPEARTFLSGVIGQITLERYWAEDGLKRMDSRR